MWFQLRVCFGVTALLAMGCQSYRPYGPGYGAPYGAYPGTMSPGPTYIQPVPQGTLPPGAYPQSAAPSNLGTPQASPYGASNNSSRSADAATNQNLVPDSGYDDPSQPAEMREPDFGEEDFQAPLDRSGPGASLENNDGDGEEFAFAELGSDAEFAEPVPLQPVSFSEPDAAPIADGARPNPYAHDGTDYRWFRGIADYDVDEKAWYVVYNPDPTAEDRYAGTITLNDHPDLIRLQRNDVVLVQGSIDNSVQDRFGKPKFQIEQVARLKPRAETGVDTANFDSAPRE